MTRALSDDQRAGILAQVPAGRLGGAQEIANAVAFRHPTKQHHHG